MITAISGQYDIMHNVYTINLFGPNRVCTVIASTFSACVKIASIVTASIEIDEITEPKKESNTAHE